MSEETKTVEIVVVDSAGRPGKTKWQFNLTDSEATIQTAVTNGIALYNAVTPCGMKSANLIIPLTVTGTSATDEGPAGTALDKVRWAYKDSAGNEGFFETAGVIDSQVVAANGILIDVTDTDVAAFIAWIIANLQSPYGEAIVAVIKAYRTWKNRKQKNI